MSNFLILLNCHPAGEDEAVKGLYRKFDHAFKHPGSLADFVANSMTNDAPYIAVYLPGGHGAMLGLPENPGMNCIKIGLPGKQGSDSQ